MKKKVYLLLTVAGNKWNFSWTLALLKKVEWRDICQEFAQMDAKRDWEDDEKESSQTCCQKKACHGEKY
jgi:hypothetical protein